MMGGMELAPSGKEWFEVELETRLAPLKFSVRWTPSGLSFPFDLILWYEFHFSCTSIEFLSFLIT